MGTNRGKQRRQRGTDGRRQVTHAHDQHGGSKVVSSIYSKRARQRITPERIEPME